MPDDAGTRADENPKNPEIEETRTSIDTLLELLKVKGKSELNGVAVALDVDPRIVENWAKVLEAGNLIKISYKVGKMYLEPMNLKPEQQLDMKTKTDVTKFILEEDIAIERISLEKFSKNIEELNKSIGSMSRVYKSKIPDIQKILDDVDKAYAPIEAKKRNIDKMKEETEKDFQEIDKKANDLNTKLGKFSSKQLEADSNERIEKLNSILQGINDAQKAMKDTEINEAKFFKAMQDDVETRVKEVRRLINDSKTTAEQNMRTNSTRINDLTKGIKEQLNTSQQFSKEVGNYKKEFEQARHDLEVLRGDFADRYVKVKQDIEREIKIVEEESKHVNSAVKSLKDSFGDLSKYDDEIKRWASTMNDLTREIATTRTEIIKLTTQLNSLDTSKEPVEKKSATMTELAKQGKKTKEKTAKIKKTIRETAEQIKERVEKAND